MRKELFAVLATTAMLSLTACGGGGGSETQTVQSQLPSGGGNDDNSSDPVPTVADAFEEISNKFSDVDHLNFSRFDVVGDGRMLVGYSADTNGTDLVLVDYTDIENITYTEVGKGDHHRGIVAEDFDVDGTLEIYTFSHGYEYVHDNGDTDMAETGENFLISEDGTIERVGGAYTHGACSGDFNGDTLPDIIDVNVNPLVRYGDGNGDFENAQDMPVGLLEYNETFTTCTAHDINNDGYDDVIFGRNSGDNHVIVYGGADNMTFSSETSIVEYGEKGAVYTLTDRGPVTTGMFTTGDYLVTFVTDYDTGTMIELFETDGTTYRHVETQEFDQGVLDIEVTGDTAVVTDTWIKAMSEYYTEPALHVTVDNGSLSLESKLREQ